jgi:hypothetical protein
LVRVNQTSDTAEFFHFPLKEHVVSRKEMQAPSAVDVPLSGLTYLRFNDFSTVCMNKLSAETRRKQYPFFPYVSQFCPECICDVPEDRLSPALLGLLTSIKIFRAVQLIPSTIRNARIFGREEDFVESIQPDKSLAVYLCTCFELKATLQRLLEGKNSLSLYAPSGEKYSSLHVAVW